MTRRRCQTHVHRRTIHAYTRHQRIMQGFRKWAWRKAA